MSWTNPPPSREWCSGCLSLAGWDTFDVSQVVPEYTVGTRRVDYALRPGSPNAVFIEVKRPGENLERHQQQLLEYCFQEGVKLAVLTNGRTWWLYLPLQAGSWEQRRFLTIDLEVQEPSVVEHRFLEYLSPERMGTGQAVGDAEDLVESQQRAEIIGKTIAAAWAQIVETPDELLVDLISETTERICGFKPEPELVEQFLAGRSQLPCGDLDGGQLVRVPGRIGQQVVQHLDDAPPVRQDPGQVRRDIDDQVAPAASSSSSSSHHSTV